MVLLLCTAMLFMPIFTLASSDAPQLYADASKSSPVSSIDGSASNYLVSIPLTAENLKQVYKFPGLQYTEYAIRFKFVSGQDCLPKGEFYHEQAQSPATLHKMLKKGEAFEHTLDAAEFHKQVISYCNKCNWEHTTMKARLEVLVPSKSGKEMVMSSTEFTINSGASSSFYKMHNKGMADASSGIIKRFTSGNFANTENVPGLNSAIERYMETKWPTEDITTVNVTYYAYTNTAGTAFKFEGAYITKKKGTGTCKYNTCYGDGTKSGNSYSISFFNSMDRETQMECGAAEKLKNR